MNAPKELTRNLPSSYLLIEMGNFRFPWLSSNRDTEKGQERLLVIQRSIQSASSVPRLRLCLMEFARELVADLVSDCKLFIIYLGR